MLTLFDFQFTDGRSFLYTDANTPVALGSGSDWSPVQLQAPVPGTAWERYGAQTEPFWQSYPLFPVIGGSIARITSTDFVFVTFFTANPPANDLSSFAGQSDPLDGPTRHTIAVPANAAWAGVTSRLSVTPVLENRTAIYAPAVISMGSIIVDGSSSGGTQTRVTIDREADIVRYSNITGLLPRVYIYSWDGLTARTIFRGRVTAPVDMNESRAVFEVLNLYEAALTGQHQNIGYQRLCNWKVYDPHTCKANRARFTGISSVVAIFPTFVSITGSPFVPALSGRTAPDNYFNGGVATIDKGGVRARRKINSSRGAIIALENPFLDIEIGDLIFLQAGCNRSLSDCINKFGNEANFGGQYGIPSRNPASTDLGRSDVPRSTDFLPPSTPRRDQRLRRRNLLGQSTGETENEYKGGFVRTRPDTGER